MLPEVAQDGRVGLAIAREREEQPIDHRLWRAWQEDLDLELRAVLERLEAFGLALPALHIKSAMAAIRAAKPD